MTGCRATPAHDGHPKVLRVSHSAVVTAWRARERALRDEGVDVRLVSAERWDEGGRPVTLESDGDDFVTSARTVGSHPNLFLFDPRPIARALREHAVDIIDVHEEPCSLAAAELRLLRRLFRPSARLLFYSAQNIFKRYPWPFRTLERQALRAAHGVYVCNEEAGRILQRKGFSRRTVVLPLGVDIERFAPRPGPPGEGVGGGGLRIGYVGRLEQRKGVDVVLDAINDEPHWYLDVVGDGPYGAALRTRVASNGLYARVHFRGFQQNLDLAEVYRGFDVLVVPSLPTPRWEEQFCRVAVEAMASGVPVVASASGALPEVVGDAGLLFPPGDSGALRQHLRRLERDDELRAELSSRSRARAERFSWKAVASGHRALYDAVLTE